MTCAGCIVGTGSVGTPVHLTQPTTAPEVGSAARCLPASFLITHETFSSGPGRRDLEGPPSQKGMGPALAEEASGAGAAAGFSPGDKTKRGFGGPSAARRGLPCDWAPGEGDGA